MSHKALFAFTLVAALSFLTRPGIAKNATIALRKPKPVISCFSVADRSAPQAPRGRPRQALRGSVTLNRRRTRSQANPASNSWLAPPSVTEPETGSALTRTPMPGGPAIRVLLALPGRTERTAGRRSTLSEESRLAAGCADHRRRLFIESRKHASSCAPALESDDAVGEIAAALQHR